MGTHIGVMSNLVNILIYAASDGLNAVMTSSQKRFALLPWHFTKATEMIYWILMSDQWRYHTTPHHILTHHTTPHLTTSHHTTPQSSNTTPRKGNKQNFPFPPKFPLSNDPWTLAGEEILVTFQNQNSWEIWLFHSFYFFLFSFSRSRVQVFFFNSFFFHLFRRKPSTFPLYCSREAVTGYSVSTLQHHISSSYVFLVLD